MNLDQFKHSGPLVCKKETVVSIIEEHMVETELNVMSESEKSNKSASVQKPMLTCDDLDGFSLPTKTGRDLTEKTDKSTSVRKTMLECDNSDYFRLPDEAGRYLMTLDKNPESREMEVADLVKVDLLETIPTTSFDEANEEHIEEEIFIDETNEEHIEEEAVMDERTEYLDIEMLDEEGTVSDHADNEMNAITENHINRPRNKGGRPAHGPQVCDFPSCGKVFNVKCRLEEHKLTHGPKNFVCSECDKRYHTQKLLNEHLRDSKKHKKILIE